MERDVTKQKNPVTLTDFNSHAHVERDYVRVIIQITVFISTHTLTWSVTIISISRCVNAINFNSHAHVERDYGYYLS